MQPNEITLVVDETNDGVTTADVDHVYSRFEEHLNRSVYIHANHSTLYRNTLGVYRTLPKVNGNFRGVQKTSFKFTMDKNVTAVDGSTIVSPVIVEVNFSFPVGVTADKQLVARQVALALLDLDSIMVPLNDVQEI